MRSVFSSSPEVVPQLANNLPWSNKKWIQQISTEELLIIFSKRMPNDFPSNLNLAYFFSGWGEVKTFFPGLQHAFTALGQSLKLTIK